jgi:hypothetical protein
MTMDAQRWELLLQRGTFNEIRCALHEIQGDDTLLHHRLLDALGEAFERGVACGKRQALPGELPSEAPAGFVQ